ncbi:micro-fibrillar-associated protein 1 [Podospora didyma]|uniref:Micro-fibrillar-associated protein 1 n=1 Tax=Podospora didyma TaxID=330526 RepID=A0AAE0K6Q8_9PEZI|nr:micro-fibrillar-associated protein 1 [Podospora didyma]
MPPKGMTANPVRPARYRAGKPVGNESSSSSGSESESDEDEKKPSRKIAPPPRFISSAARAAPTGPGKIISRGNNAKIDLKGVGLGPTEQEAAQARAAAAKARIEAERKAKEEGFVTEDEDEGGNSDEEGSDEESSEEEEEEESEEEAPRRLMMRPKFIPKSQREGAGTTTTEKSATPGIDDKATAQAAEAEAAAARQREVDEMVEEQIRKDLAAKRSGRKHWEDDADAGASGDDLEVDDTDDLDPEAEKAAWVLRELRRVRREREAIEAKERELAELERRRNLTSEERAAEDAAHIAAQQSEKEGRGKMSYMQKYFHKGAFFGDSEEAAALASRDVMGARFADEVKNRELLPKSLQMRDMTKLGKKGATRYRDLASEDTGQWGRLDGGPRRGDFFGGGGRDGDERFLPDQHRGGGGWDRDNSRDGGSGAGGGANAIPLGDRKSAAAPPAPPLPPSSAPDGPRNDRPPPPRATGEREDHHRDDGDGDRREKMTAETDGEGHALDLPGRGTMIATTATEATGANGRRPSPENVSGTKEVTSGGE